MIADSLQLHRAAIAYLYGSVVQTQRDDNLAFYDEVMRNGGDYPELLQGPTELVLSRRGGNPPGSQLAEVRIGTMHGAMPGVAAPVPAAFRCLVAEQGSNRPFKFFVDSAESVYGTFSRVWGVRVGKLQLVEVSIVATLARENGDAAAFLRDRVVRTGSLVQSHLGRDYDQVSVKYLSGMALAEGPAAPVLPLPDAQVEISLETAPQDPRSLVLSMVVRWQALQLRLSDLVLPEELKRQIGARKFIERNTDAKPPTEYLSPAYEYLEGHVVPFLAAADQ